MTRIYRSMPVFYNEQRLTKDTSIAISRIERNADLEAVDYSEQINPPGDPFRKSTIDELHLVNQTRTGLSKIKERVDRLGKLTKTATQTLPSYEREFLTTEYNFITSELKQIAKETKFNNSRLFEVSADEKDITLNKKLFSILGAHPVASRINLMVREVFGINFFGDEVNDDEEEALPTSPLISQTSASENLGHIVKSFGHLDAIDDSLDKLGSQIYDHLVHQVTAGKTGLLRDKIPGSDQAREISEQIFMAAESALSAQLGEIPDNILDVLT